MHNDVYDLLYILARYLLAAREIRKQVFNLSWFSANLSSAVSVLNAVFFEGRRYLFAPSRRPIKRPLLTAFVASPSSLMTIPIPLLHQWSGRSIFAPESTFEAASQPESGGVLMSADKTHSRTWDSCQVSSRKSPKHNRPIQDLIHTSLAGSRLSSRGYALKIMHWEVGLYL